MFLALDSNFLQFICELFFLVFSYVWAKKHRVKGMFLLIFHNNLLIFGF
jgi:hypothetical protein